MGIKLTLDAKNDLSEKLSSATVVAMASDNGSIVRLQPVDVSAYVVQSQKQSEKLPDTTIPADLVQESLNNASPLTVINQQAISQDMVKTQVNVSGFTAQNVESGSHAQTKVIKADSNNSQTATLNLISTEIVPDAVAQKNSIQIQSVNVNPEDVQNTKVIKREDKDQTVTADLASIQMAVQQNVPAIEIKASKDSPLMVDNTVVNQEKPALTPAKTWLMEAVNRSFANNSSENQDKGTQNSNSQSNDMLLGGGGFNKINENLTTSDPKAFSTVLGAEKQQEEISLNNASPLVHTDNPENASDKAAAAQTAISMVNKFAHDAKLDVPSMTKPLMHPDWNQEMGDRILWMNNRNISSAEIRLNPEHMGPVSIRIDINQDQATIAFMAQNASVRDALEASIPKLRDMLSTQQLNLADVSVSSQSNSNTEGRSQSFNQQMGDAAMNSQSNQRNNPTLDVNGNLIGSTNNSETENIENAQVIGDNGTNGLLSIYA